MPPVVIAGALAGAATIGGAALSSSATKKAANKAADTSLQTAQMNNALTQGIYNQNTANIRPFMQSGQRANALLDNLIYGYQEPQMEPGQPMGNALMNGTSPLAYRGRVGGGFDPQSLYDGGGMDYMPPGAPQPGYVPQGAVTTSAPNAQNAWDAFRNSTNYQFRLGEGLKAANQGYAARGVLQSGAAMKGLNNYAQNFASNELGNWTNLLQGQQSLGLSGANALAGVGTNMVGQVTANNNAAGTAAANAALMAGQANAGFYGSAAGAIGNILGSSYGIWGK